ncbi:MAG: hypothetical protein J0I01_12495 [Stenotrophomonas nitritireducens]|uniref:magnesium transporter CorA family protein n=2 Tax=Stenotrophomonas TaxID=40323 RepID=UPI001AC3F679|nr:CorA family divalent cation transporter [Stenotrophomonas sp. PS02297]MBN8769001.1 hypothetical protein [Stenotrophomonas sp.]MBN8793039.1 hypothetical protein [Stenotrophomonas nitritireducens]
MNACNDEADRTADDARLSFFCRMFDASGVSQRVAAQSLVACRPAEDALAWVDLCDPKPEEVDAVWAAWELPAAARQFLEHGTVPEVGQSESCFWVRAVVAGGSGDKDKLRGIVLVCVASTDRVVTFRRERIDFLEQMRVQQPGKVGVLRAESFVVTLLDRLLASYFKAIDEHELAIERLEVSILGKGACDALNELQRLRRWASRLRRMLAPHRIVFSAMSRPDFRPDEGRVADRHFIALNMRFERALDMVENAREQVLGSFELFSNQTALRTNQAMRMLTFVTVITGLMATIVGALGMNFGTRLFKSDDAGFYAVIAGLVALGAGAFLLGRRRRWF